MNFTERDEAIASWLAQVGHAIARRYGCRYFPDLEISEGGERLLGMAPFWIYLQGVRRVKRDRNHYLKSTLRQLAQSCLRGWRRDHFSGLLLKNQLIGILPSTKGDV